MNLQEYKKTSDSLKKIFQYSSVKKVEKKKDNLVPQNKFTKYKSLTKKLPKKSLPPFKFATKSKPLPEYRESVQTVIEKELPPEFLERLNKLEEKFDVKELAKATVEEIKNLKGNERMDISHIRNGERLAALAQKSASGGFDMNDQRWHGGGSSGGNGTTLHLEIPVGTIDDTNVTFTVNNQPLFINVNGGQYTVGKGMYQSYSLGTIQLSSPVGTGGFILSFYQS